ncbi:MAG: slipin family protein, partial [Patescibacteria group bacterium]
TKRARTNFHFVACLHVWYTYYQSGNGNSPSYKFLCFPDLRYILFMNNRSSNPVGSFISLVVFSGFGAYILVQTGVISAGYLVIAIVLLFFLILLIAGLRIIDQYDRGVVLTLGKYTSTRSPGLTWLLIGIQRMIKIDLRITTTDIPQQEVITKDNVPVGINAVVYFQVQSAENAILNIKDYTTAVSQYAQAALRDVIGAIELDPLLSEREKIAEEVQKIVSAATQSWGILVTDIKIQDIELPADMKRVMAKQAESERERRAIVIKAKGEFEAAGQLSQAAHVLSATPGGISMRTLQTIEKINPDPSKTVIFALPIEFFEGIKSLSQFLKEKTK